MWDLPGQKQYTGYSLPFCAKADTVIICMDLTIDPKNCCIKKWVKDILVCKRNPPLIVFAANKSDIHQQSKNYQSNIKEIKALSQQYHTEFIITSAKTGENVQNLFSLVAKLSQNRTTKKFLIEKPELTSTSSPPEEKGMVPVAQDSEYVFKPADNAQQIPENEQMPSPINSNKSTIKIKSPVENKQLDVLKQSSENGTPQQNKPPQA